MNWPDERYVRLYTRDTPGWLCLSFDAQSLFCLLLRKVDRAGVLDLGKVGRKGVFVGVGHAHLAARLDPALDELIADGCIEITRDGERMVIPNFIEAQECEASDKARCRKWRETRRDKARAGVTPRDTSDTPRDAPDTPRVTGDGTDTPRVTTDTPNHAVPAMPSRAESEASSAKAADAAPAAPASPSQPALQLTPDEKPPVVVALLPCAGKQKEFPITQALVDEWAASYPGVDVPAEVRAAVQWSRDNPQKRKTAAGARRFLGSWMARQQNRGGRGGGSDKPKSKPRILGED
jgi:hypothetical protein